MDGLYTDVSSSEQQHQRSRSPELGLIPLSEQPVCTKRCCVSERQCAKRGYVGMGDLEKGPEEKNRADAGCIENKRALVGC